jgi:hypothetical protein
LRNKSSLAGYSYKQCWNGQFLFLHEVKPPLL